MLFCAIRGILGFVISQAVVFEEYSPFGVAFAVSGGGGLAGLLGAVGVALGYLRLWQLADSLKYIAGTVVAFTAVYAFRDTETGEKKFFAPIVAALALACVGFVFIAGMNFSTSAVTLFVCEIILAFSATYFYTEVFSGRDESENFSTAHSISVLAFMATVLLGFSGVRLVGGLSVGRFAAMAAVLLAGYSGGFGAGAAAGVTMGLVFDISGGGGFYSMSYGLCGLIAGAAAGAGRLATAAVFVIASAATILMGGAFRFMVLYEAFVVSALFALMPEQWLPELDWLKQYLQKGGAREVNRAKSILSGAARAFRELHDTLKSGIEHESKQRRDDISRVFDRAADSVCRRCALKGLCWERDCLNTYNIMNDLTPHLRENGKLAVTDLPPHFASRCLKVEHFITAINEEMKMWQQRRANTMQLARGERTICGQYAEVAEIFGQASAELGMNISEDREAARKAKKLARRYDAQASADAWHAPGGRLYVELSGKAAEEYAKISSELSAELGVEFCEPELSHENETVLLKSREPIVAEVGISSVKRRGSTNSGDSAVNFKTEDGKLYALISDGMGSGASARAESARTLRLMERFLRAGIEPHTALSTTSSAFSLKNEEDVTFATLDLLQIDLFSGRGLLLKCGAAPTYFRSGGKVSRAGGKSLPAGMLPGARAAEELRLRMGSCNLAVMVSDGVSDGTEDAWLRELIAAFTGEPEKLAEEITAEAYKKSNGGDDITAVVITIDDRR